MLCTLLSVSTVARRQAFAGHAAAGDQATEQIFASCLKVPLTLASCTLLSWLWRLS